jgi:hypothetical protein
VRPRRALAAAALLALAAPAAALPAGPTDRQAAARAAAWLRTVRDAAPGQQADAIVALAAAGSGRGVLGPRLSRLAGVAPAYASTAGAAGKVALAAEAAGADPRRLRGVDYLARVRGAYAAGRYGASGFDQALAMLALAGAGDRVPAAAVAALRADRGAGGWGNDLSPSGRDDVSTTAILIEALRATGVRSRDPMLRSAATWMAAQANTQGGYAFFGGRGPTEANSTALVIRALRALGRTPPAASRAALRALQLPNGSIAFTATSPGSPLLATVDALVALAGATLPPRPGGA